MRVVLDTNVLVSAVLGGTSREVLDRWRSSQFVVITSSDILEEYLSVLKRPKFKLPPSVIDSIALFVFRNSEIVIERPDVKAASTDPKDDRFLIAALVGQADVIVSGDRHLLDLKQYQEIPIVSVRVFLDMLR